MKPGHASARSPASRERSMSEQPLMLGKRRSLRPPPPPSQATSSDGRSPDATSPDNKTDVFLMARTAERDAEAFTRLYEVHFQAVVGFLAARAGPDVPHADLAQEVFLRLWRNAGRFQRRSAVRTYLLAMATNVLKEYLAKRRTPKEERWIAKLQAPRCDYGCAYCTASTEIEAAACRNDLELAMARRVANMPPRTRQAIELVVLQRQGVHQAARISGCSVETFQKRLQRALKTLRGIFGTPPSAPDVRRRSEWDDGI